MCSTFIRFDFVMLEPCVICIWTLSLINGESNLENDFCGAEKHSVVHSHIGPVGMGFRYTMLTHCHNRRWLVGQPYIMRCHYNPIKFLQIPHKRHPIARQWGRNVGCFLWIQILIYVQLQYIEYCMQYHIVLDHVIRSLDYIITERVVFRDMPLAQTHFWNKV